MKRRFLLVVLLLIVFLSKVWSGQQINFTGSLFYNSTNSTITVQLWITNTSTGGSGCGNQNLDLAVIRFGLQWNRQVLTLQSWNFFPSGSGLDSTEYFTGGNGTSDDIPDLTTKGLRNLTTKADSTIDFIRSTNLCNNTVHLACDATVLLFQAVFYIDPSLAGNYDYTHPNDNTNYPTYIAEFNNGTSAPSNSSKEILFIANRPYDTPGNDCPAGSTVGNNVSNVPDDNADDVFVNTQAPLAVNLLSFNIQRMNNGVILDWITTSETNNKGFEIQRRIDRYFEPIGFVNSKGNIGYSTNNLRYQYNDVSLSKNEGAYYRIKMLGFNNKASYSEIKYISGNAKSLQVMLYPNPAAGFINVILPGNILNDIDISVVDMSGRVIRTYKQLKGGTFVITGLNKGFYLLKIQSKYMGQIDSQRFTIL